MRQSHRFSSSESSSLDPTGFEPQEEEDNLFANVEQFNSNIERFRNQIMEMIEEDNVNEMQGQRGNVPNLRIHSSFSPLSKSIRALWRRHPRLFKTVQILKTSCRLATAIKDANCGQLNPNTVLETLEQLENSVAIALRNALLQQRFNQRTKFVEPKDNEEINEDEDDNLDDDDDEDDEEEEEEKCSVKSAKANSSSGVSSSPNGPIKIVRRHSAFQLPSQRIFGPNKFASPPSRPQHVSICPTAQSKQLTKGKIDHPTEIDKKLLQKKTSTESLANTNNNNNKRNTNQQNQCSMLVELLEQRNDGMELAFERCKCWSKFATQLLNYARNRLALDLEYGQRQQKLAEQQLGALASSTWSESTQMMPLASIFGHLVEANQKFAKRAESTVQELQQRFVASLESRQKEHDAKRRKMKAEYAKCRKQMDSCLEELKRARQTHTIKGEQYLRARDVTLRQERECHQMLPSAMKLPNGQMLISNEQLFQKRRREVEKRRRAEGEALNRKSDAELEVCRLESELNQRRTNLAELRCRTVAELADLIRQCELTTIACTSTLLKGIASLWGPVPSEMERLADAARSSQPAKEFLTFLQQQSMGGTIVEQQSSQCPTSASSIVEGQTSIPEGRPTTLLDPNRAVGEGGTLASITSSLPSPSRAIQRRNALTAAEEHLLMAEAQQHQQKRRGKTSVGRLFDYPQIAPSTSDLRGIEERSEAAKSHRLQRTRQVTKCAQCEHLLLFDALKCQCCALVWHKKCLPQVQLWCGPSAATQSLLISGGDKRRTSIFGVPLRGHLEAQQRQVPLIIERCVDELQRRGLGCKGLYRTCGVKSKVEEICAQFEQNPPNGRVDLASVHPMNIASVVKLYLRRLPEPLLTFSLYPDWLRIDEQLQIGNREKSNIEKVLAELVKQLPEHNFHTLRFLMLHLNRVTWYEQQNLMTASNLAAVIAPSLIWQRLPSMSAPNSAPLFQSPQFINDAHRQTRAIELLIEYAFEVFEVDRVKDRRQFFLDYPGLTPPPADPEKMIGGEGIGQAQAETAQLDEELVEDEDDEEEEEELLEEEMELLVATAVEPMKLRTRSLGISGGGCDSGIGSNSGTNSETAAGAQKKEGMESSSSDLDCGSSAASTFRRLNQQNNKLHIYPSNNSTRPPFLPTGPSSTLISNNSTNRRPETAPSTRRLNGKQRSYTTSILVSPLADRRNMPPPPPSQKDQEGTSKRPIMLTQRSLEEATAAEKPRINECGTLLRSGEVTIQLGQDCSTAAEREEQRGGRRHSQSKKHPPAASLGPYPSTDAEEDVSYV